MESPELAGLRRNDIGKGLPGKPDVPRKNPDTIKENAKNGRLQLPVVLVMFLFLLEL